MRHRSLLTVFTLAVAAIVGAIVVVMVTGSWWVMAAAYVALLVTLGLVSRDLSAYLRDGS